MIIGCTKIDNDEIDDDNAPRKSHKTLATIVDAEGNEHDMLRDNMHLAGLSRRNSARTSSVIHATCG